jgi:hypothetical protein
MLVTPDVTKTWFPGVYSGQGHVSSKSENKSLQVFAGYLKVVQSALMLPPGADTRSPWTIIRDNCVAMLTNRATSDILDTQIGETSFKRMSPEQLLSLYDRAQQAVSNEIAQSMNDKGMGNGRHLYAIFTRPL